MIQRIQTIYLVLAILLLVLCCCMPLATFEPQGMGIAPTMYNLCLLGADGILSYLPMTLFVIIVMSEIACVFALMGYKNRRQQMRTAAWAMAFQLLWLINYAGYALFLVKNATFHPEFSACLPAIAFVFTWLAYRAIRADENLVRSADRIR